MGDDLFTGDNAMWKITEDFFDDDEVLGIRSNNFDESKENLLVHKFIVYDDDGVPYFQGVSSCGSSFAPLDFGAASLGATEIRYYCEQNGIIGWHTL